MDAKLREAIEGIHASPTKAVIAATGGGAQALAWLLGVPNASNTVLEITVPYADAALTELLGRTPRQVVSEDVAMEMAQLAYERASHLSDGPPVTGIGATATIRTQREKRGEHRCFIALCSSGGSRGYGLTMVKGMRERQEEDEIVSRLIVRLLAEESGVSFGVPLGLSDRERLEVLQEPAGDPVRDLLEGSVPYIVADMDGSVSTETPYPTALLPGSFYPLHGGHEALARVASEILGTEVAFELSTTNVDKPPLKYADVSRRLRQFEGRGIVVLTRAATFAEKARVLPGSTFVIGFDTAMRLFDPKYYGGSQAAMVEALEELRGSGGRFLVAGRVEDERFRSLDDVGVPTEYRDMLAGIPESAFRRDVSSTEIRGGGSKAMKFKDLREFLEFLEERGELKRVSAPVSRDLEITEISDRLVKSGGPALLFENVEGFDTPLVINLYGTHQRVAWALGVDDVEEIVARIRKLTSLPQAPPKGLVDKLRTLGDLAGLARSQPRTVRNAPCQEVVLTGDDASLDRLPILTCWPKDGGRFITLPLVISRDPASGRRNVGTYRMQVYDSRTTGMHWQSHKVGARHYRTGERMQTERIDVAVALGGDPTTMWSGSMPLPPEMDELAVSGVLRQEPVELVRCKTIDLEVPAHSEIVLEGYVVPGETRAEGPFGDHTGYYSLPDEYSVFHLTAITHRDGAIYPTTVVGRPPSEDYFMGKASERIMLPALQLTVPEIVDMNMPAEGIFTNYVLVSIRKEYPGHAQKVMYALWGIGQMALVKGIVVFDEHVNIHDLSEVAWRLGVNIDPKRDILFVDGPADDLDHAASTPRLGSKIGIDATEKIAGEGVSREWPDEIVMSGEIKSLVDSRWAEYGL